MADEIRSAGAVLWRSSVRGAEVQLVHRPKYDDWSLPKGKLEPGEHMLQAAVREVAEETGLQATLGRRLPPVRYLASGAPKRVDYWVAVPADPAGEFVPNREVDKLAWVPADESAAHRLTYQRDVETVAAFLAGPWQTTPLIVLRHASAGSREDWHGADAARPLDAEGHQEAEILASLLSCFGVSRVVSSPAERCVATVRPYAAAVGGSVDVEPAFDIPQDGVAGHHASSAADAGKVATALTAGREPVIICGHRENLPVIIAAACAELGAQPPAGGPLRKAEFLVLHRAAVRLAAAERYRPSGDD